MTESLLSFSEVLLFGRVVEDLNFGRKNEEPAVSADADAEHDVQLATTEEIVDFENAEKIIDGVDIAAGNAILVRANRQIENGVYTVEHTEAVQADPGANPPVLATPEIWHLRQRAEIPKNELVKVEFGDDLGGSIWKQKKNPPQQRFKPKKSLDRMGKNKQLLDQLRGKKPAFAKIYGFSYEGTYFELPEPTIFLVHGKGKDAFAASGAMARSPLNPSQSGVASADYQVADGIKVWPYDKADYTIRMDVMSGMFEQVLLDIYFGFDSPAISGAKVSGAKVSGAKVSGAKVSGAKVSGAKVSGAKARGSGD